MPATDTTLVNLRGTGLSSFRLAPATAPGAPLSGNYRLGEWYLDSTGAWWRCTAAGSPGTWAPAGTVTSVGLSAPASLLTVSASPVTGAGTLALSLVAAAAGMAWMGPTSGGPATPAYRALVATDIPALDWSKITSGKPTTLAGYGITDALPLTGGTLTGALTLAADPVAALQPTTKQYVDNLAAGIDVRASVLAASTANLTLSGTQTIDGVVCGVGARILAKNQTTPSQNGPYIVAAGAWTRTTDMDLWTEFPGAFLWVEQGTVNGDTGWVCTVDTGGTLGTTAIAFSQFAGAGTITAGTGISVSGNQVSLANVSALSVKGNATNATAAPTDLAASTDGHVLRRSGTTLGFGLLTATASVQMSTARLLGRTTAATGLVEELTVGSDMSLTGGVLTVGSNVPLKNAANIFTGANILTVADGSAGSPAIKRTATNDGFYFTAGTVLVAISGSQRHYLQNDRIISNANAVAVGSGGLSPSMGPGHTLWGADGAGTGFNASTFGAAPVNYFRRADNTGASPNAVAASTYVGGMFFQTFDGSSYIENARIAVLTNQLQAVGSSGCRISLQVTPNGSASLSEVASITGAASTWTVPLVVGAGSASAVSVSLVDAGNGLYRPSANVLAFATSGAFAMAIGSNGVVMPDGQGAAVGLTTFNAGATTPRLQQNTVNAGRASHAMSVFGTSATAAPEVIFGRSNSGSYATYATTTTGFVFGRIGGEGVDAATTPSQFRRGTCIVFEQDGAAGATMVPGLIRLQTAMAAAGTLTDGLVLNALQQVVFGASSYIGSERARFAGGTIAAAGATDLLIGGGSLDMGTSLRYRGTQVVAARNTGWTAQTATASKADLGASPTVGAIASFCRALWDALSTHGLIGI